MITPLSEILNSFMKFIKLDNTRRDEIIFYSMV